MFESVFCGYQSLHTPLFQTCLTLEVVSGPRVELQLSQQVQVPSPAPPMLQEPLNFSLSTGPAIVAHKWDNL